MVERVSKFIEQHFADSLNAIATACDDNVFVEACYTISDLCARTLCRGGKLLLAGNGGSAGDAQHIAGEFISRLNFDRAPLAAIALTVDTSVLTAVGNDYGYEKVFERQVLALAQSDDVVIGISTSGKSPNVLAALSAGRRKGATTVGFTGRRIEAIEPLCDAVLSVSSASTPLIQQVHITAAHAICGFIEMSLFERAE